MTELEQQIEQAVGPRLKALTERIAALEAKLFPVPTTADTQSRPGDYYVWPLLPPPPTVKVVLEPQVMDATVPSQPVVAGVSVIEGSD